MQRNKTKTITYIASKAAQAATPKILPVGGL